MANYKTHSLFNILVALPICLFLLLRYIAPDTRIALIFGACFIYTTLFMSPDLDLAHQIKLFSLRGILSLPFRLYAKVFSHRGISHWPIIGSLTRILWLAIPFFAAIYLFDRFTLSQKNLIAIWNTHHLTILAGMSGIVLADFFHLLLDIKIR